MDWRNRAYYLVAFDWLYHNQQIAMLKRNIPTIKIHSPYRHFKNWDKTLNGFVDINHVKGMYRATNMISCDAKDKYHMNVWLNTCFPKNGVYVVAKQLTKEVCGQ